MDIVSLKSMIPWSTGAVKRLVYILITHTQCFSPPKRILEIPRSQNDNITVNTQEWFISTKVLPHFLSAVKK